MTIGERIRELSSEIIEMDARWKVLWDLQNHGDNSNGTEREIGDIEYQFRAKGVERSRSRHGWSFGEWRLLVTHHAIQRQGCCA